MVLETADVWRVVAGVPVVGDAGSRTRGSTDHPDLHVWFAPATPLAEAHRLSHVVKDRLLEAFPALADVIIHIEPPPE